MKNSKRNLDEWLDAVSVHDADHETFGKGLEDWFGVSVDYEGGIIAYFRDVDDAFRFRLDYINRQMNP